LSWTRSEQYRATFLRLLAAKPGERILDVGAGRGAVADLVQRATSCEVHALDPSKKRIESMQKNRPNLKACLSGSESIPYPDGFFDRAYSTMAVHHFSDQPRSFRELARVLKPEGSLVIMDISPQTLIGRIERFWENGVMGYHLTFLDMESMVSLLKEEGGFEVAEAKREGSANFVRALKKKGVAQP
jgi:ubiquinone/menaquinone biosynthesis C-methylase UbiE